MKKFDFVEILHNGVPLNDGLREDAFFNSYRMLIESKNGEACQKTVVVPIEEEKLLINGIEVEREPNVIWCRKENNFYKVNAEEVFTYDDKLNFIDERRIWALKGDALKVAFSCKNQFPESSLFHYNLLDNPNLNREMKSWFKHNMTSDWFIKNFDENMSDKEILSYFKTTDLFSELESMYELLISKKSLEPAFHLKILVLVVKKIDVLSNFLEFL